LLKTAVQGGRPEAIEWRDMMRFMMLMIPLGYEAASPGTMPPAEAVAAMMEYNEALKEAGVLITLDGLHPPSMGARISFAGGKPVVTDGPFTEAKEVIGGYALVDVPSKKDALEVARQFMELHRLHWPSFEGESEVRQLEGF
jgi:hypothetical protein